jgi:acetyl-CoA carboxylase biotin carboxyl carrier protein
MRVYKLIPAEAREQMSSQDRPETTGAASAPARDPEQPAAPRGDAPPSPAASATGGTPTPREPSRRHARRRHRPGGGPEAREPREGREPREPRQPREARESQSGEQPERELNLDELRELAELINEQGFTEFEIERAGFRLRISRHGGAHAPHAAHAAAPSGAHPFVPPAITPTAPPAAHAAGLPAPPPASAAPPADANAGAEPAAPAEDLFVLTSPIVGTFYRSPSPTAESFVSTGSRVQPDTVVCIIEAMKLMNEIQAETSGTVEEIYVENGQPVEYGQALFGIRK